MESTRGTAVPSPLAVTLAGLLAAAGLLHMSVVRPHLETGMVDPTLFVLSAVAQVLVAGWVLLKVNRWSLLAALAVTVPPVLAWAVSRTVGLPWGHTSGAAADVQVLGSLTTSMEVFGAALALFGLLSARYSRPLTSFGTGGLVAAGISLALVFGGTAAAALLTPTGHGHTESSGNVEEDHGHSEGSGTTGEGHGQAEGSGAADEGHAHTEGSSATTEHPGRSGEGPAGGAAPPSDESSAGATPPPSAPPGSDPAESQSSTAPSSPEDHPHPEGEGHGH